MHLQSPVVRKRKVWRRRVSVGAGSDGGNGSNEDEISCLDYSMSKRRRVGSGKAIPNAIATRENGIWKIEMTYDGTLPLSTYFALVSRQFTEDSDILTPESPNMPSFSMESELETSFPPPSSSESLDPPHLATNSSHPFLSTQFDLSDQMFSQPRFPSDPSFSLSSPTPSPSSRSISPFSEPVVETLPTQYSYHNPAIKLMSSPKREMDWNGIENRKTTSETRILVLPYLRRNSKLVKQTPLDFLSQITALRG
jgi:hypothetical protein